MCFVAIVPMVEPLIHENIVLRMETLLTSKNYVYTKRKDTMTGKKVVKVTATKVRSQRSNFATPRQHARPIPDASGNTLQPPS